MDPLLTTLGQLGLGLATNAVYDLLKGAVGKPVAQVEAQIQNVINLNGISMQAATVISALAQNGFISIQQSNLHGHDGLIFGSVKGAASVGNNSTLTTKNTAISAGIGASMVTQGNAQVRQNPDGSISFHTGEDGSISFFTKG